MGSIGIPASVRGKSVSSLYRNARPPPMVTAKASESLTITPVKYGSLFSLSISFVVPATSTAVDRNFSIIASISLCPFFTSLQRPRSWGSNGGMVPGSNPSIAGWVKSEKKKPLSSLSIVISACLVSLFPQSLPSR